MNLARIFFSLAGLTILFSFLLVLLHLFLNIDSSMLLVVIFIFNIVLGILFLKRLFNTRKQILVYFIVLFVTVASGKIAYEGLNGADVYLPIIAKRADGKNKYYIVIEDVLYLSEKNIVLQVDKKTYEWIEVNRSSYLITYRTFYFNDWLTFSVLDQINM